MEACEHVSGLLRTDGAHPGVECLGVIKGVSDDGTAASRGGQQDDRTPPCMRRSLEAASAVVQQFFSDHARPEGYLGAAGMRAPVWMVEGTQAPRGV
jgi:hypothetical protein